MTMTNDVLEQLNYLKLKSAYSYLNSLVMNNEIAEKELHVMHKILNDARIKTGLVKWKN